MVAMSDFSTFSQMTYTRQATSVKSAEDARSKGICWSDGDKRSSSTYWNAIGVFLSDALGLSLALLERVLVLELGTHGACLS